MRVLMIVVFEIAEGRGGSKQEEVNSYISSFFRFLLLRHASLYTPKILHPGMLAYALCNDYERVLICSEE